MGAPTGSTFGGRKLLQVTSDYAISCPNDSNTAYDCLNADPNFSVLVDLIDAAGLTQTIQSKANELSIFAPNNDLLEGELASFGNVSIPDFLAQGGKDLLLYHVASHKIAYGSLPKGTGNYSQSLQTLRPGHSLTVKLDNPASGNGKTITTVEAETNKARAYDRTVFGKVVIYAIDAILLTSDAAAAAPTAG
eukprot:scaffold12.g7909.t1